MKNEGQRNEYKLSAYVGEEWGEGGYTEMEFNGFEDAVIFRDSKENEIWLNPDALEKMVDDLKEFSEKIKSIRRS